VGAGLEGDLRIGIAGRPHGNDGAFVVVEPTERLELLEPGRTVMVGDRRLDVASRRGTAERPLLKLDGVNGRAAAQELRGQPITVPRSAVPLGEGEFLVDDLVGCEAYDGRQRIGIVRDVLLLPAADVLEVEREGEAPLLVPLVGDAIRSIDTEQRRVEIDRAFLDAD
jgi:16S rRNA processing protein RimM